MYTPSIIVDQVIEALAVFIAPLCPGAEIVRAQVNRVPMPPNPCVVLTELLRVGLETPGVVFDATLGQSDIARPSRIDVQIDFYGDNAGDQCGAVETVYRTEYATAQFPDGIKPLYCSDGIQSPMISGEQQWQSRWTLTASMQYNPVVTVPQDSANVATVDIFDAVDL